MCNGPAVILMEPQLGENIGAAARAMANFGLSDLRLVAPKEPWPNEKAVAAASGADEVLNAARVFPGLREATADLHFLCATTARPREMVKPVMTPATAIAACRERMAEGAACGFLFGRERWGLDNEAISLCDVIVMAPVNPAFASLNLAQAVLIVGYEWRKGEGSDALGRHTQFDGKVGEGLPEHAGPPATKAELHALFDHLERELDASGFLQPPEKRPHMVRNIRAVFTRMQPTEQEVRTLRGVIASLCRQHRPRPK
ncbi:MAG: RNA methyltransferase [Hyphomicrobiales bacterium]|nr:RNA methyltransferase [Hyphomicrobiales bacterium]